MNKNMSISKEIRSVIRDAEKRGWFLRVSGRKPKLVHKRFGTLTFSRTPSKGNCHKELERDIKRREMGLYVWGARSHQKES